MFGPRLQSSLVHDQQLLVVRVAAGDAGLSQLQGGLGGPGLVDDQYPVPVRGGLPGLDGVAAVAGPAAEGVATGVAIYLSGRTIPLVQPQLSLSFFAAE